MNLRFFAMLTMILSASGCHSPSSDLPPKWLLSTEETHVNPALTAKREGFDNYAELYNRSWRRDIEALKTFFSRSAIVPFDGASAQSHGYLLYDLLCHLGDEVFSDALRVQSTNVRKNIIDHLDYGSSDQGIKNYKNKFPVTYSLALHDPL
jgi:hypothetical protein